MTIAADKGELIEMPNGSKLYYVDADHSYWRCKEDGGRGRRLTGVTTVVKPCDWKPDGLMKWAVRLSLEGVVRGFQGDHVPDDPFVLQARLQNMRLDWESIRDDAGTRGTNVHEQVLHALARGEEIPDLDDLTDEERGYGQAVMKWWFDRKPKVLQAEQVVLSEDLGVAGRFDLRCEIEGMLNPVLVDAKTSNFIGAGAHAQIAGYAHLAEQSGFGDSNTLLVLQLRDDGSYRELPVCADRDDFMAAVQVYRRVGRINAAAYKERKRAA